MLSDNILWAILSTLENEYPNPVENAEDLLPNHPEKDVILKHICYLCEEQFIKAIPVREDDSIIDYKDITATSAGIDFLGTLAPSSK